MATLHPQNNFCIVELDEEKQHEGLLHVESKQKSAFVRVKILDTGPYVGHDWTNHGWVQRAQGSKVRKGDRVLVTRQDLLQHFGAAGELTFFVRDNQVIASYV